MKLPTSVLLIFVSITLCGQETINPGQDVMGTFTSGDTECYQLTIEETGEYVLTFNLWDATISVMNPDQQQIFTDYMTIFEPSPRSQELTINIQGTYKICFSRGAGETAMYQCRIVSKNDPGTGITVPLQYGDYDIKDLSVDGSAAKYSFNGNENEKIRIGISMIFAVNVKLTSPTETVLYDHSFETPPTEGLKLEFDLEETGEHIITITPLNIYLQFTISLYLIEPVRASAIQFNETYGGTLVNFGVDYYEFYAQPEDTVTFRFSGSTSGISMNVITPSSVTIHCNDTIDEIHIVHSLIINEEGINVLVISNDNQGINSYGLIVETTWKPEDPEIVPYVTGTLIAKELFLSDKQKYSFNASKGDILRIGLDLPSKAIELMDFEGSILYSLYDTLSAGPGYVDFGEIELDADGEYFISIWHGSSEYNPATMKFCCSVVAETINMQKDSTYTMSIPAYHRLSYAFNADSGDIVRMFLSIGSEMIIPSGDTVKIVSSGDSYILKETGIYKINLYNKNSFPVDQQLWIDTSLQFHEIPFGIFTSYEMSGIYTCNVPQELDHLFVIVKKDNFYGYDDTWRGNVPLIFKGKEWQSMVGNNTARDDFIFQLQQPQSGEYMLKVIAEDRSEEVEGSILFTDHLPEAQLNGWSTGLITRPSGSDWKVVDVGEQVDTLFFETEGFGLWSTVYISYDSINNPFSHWIFSNFNAGYNIHGQLINPPAGRYFIRYHDSAVLQESGEGYYNHSEDQSRTYLLYVGTAVSDNSGVLALRDVSTTKLGTGKASVTLFGSGLSTVNSVLLVNKEGLPDISMNIQGYTDDGHELVANYDFNGAQPGIYRLEIQNEDTLIRYKSTIEILPVATVRITSTLLTSDQYRLGRPQQCIIRIKNTGTTDIPYAAGYFYTKNDQVSIMVTNTPASHYEADSINNIILKNIHFTEMPFFITDLLVGEEVSFIFKIFSSTVVVDETFDLGYKVAVISETEYFSLLDELIADWYHFMTTSEVIPASMKYYLNTLTLERFIAIWHGDDDGEIQGKGTSAKSNMGKAQNFEHIITTAIKLLSFAADKGLPFSSPFGDASEVLEIITNPFNAATAGVMAIWNVAKKVSSALDSLLDSMAGDDSNEENEYVGEDELTIYPITSTTPEDKYGPAGYSDEFGNKYIDSLIMFEYRIDYWNKEDATAPAAIVYIRDTIDPDFDLKTLRFTEIGFLKWKVKLDGGQYFNVNVDCRPDMPYIVNVEGTVDHNSREVYWVHTTLDPITMDLPDDPMSGYLPPIDSTGYQIGWVNYTINPDGEPEHNASFENQAFVNFDGVGAWGPAPPDGPYTSIFDFISPWSYIETLDPVQSELTFDISLISGDQGSGIDHFNIYVSEDHADASLWKTTTDTIVSFTGEYDIRYEFHSIACDRVGNYEEMKNTYDTYTVIKSAQTGMGKPPFSDSNKMKIIPNPNDGNFSVEIDEIFVRGILEITDLTGRIIYEEEYTNGEYVNLKYLDSGIYLVLFNSAGKILSSKLIINH